MTKLHLFSCISNPVGYKRRYQLFREFRKRMEANPNIIFHGIEMAFGDRPFEVTDASNPNDVQLRGNTELWHKENLLDIGMKRFDWDKAAYADSDIAWAREDFAEETLRQLDHYHVVQMFGMVYDMDPHYELQGGVAQSYVNNWFQRGRNHYLKTERQYTKVGAPGYAWAFRRDAFEKLGGLYSSAILGSGDYYMADAMCGNEIAELTDEMHPGYLASAEAWRQKALKLNENIGFVSGTIFHHFHGARVNRGYNWRNNILIEHQYNPETDIRYDTRGLIVLNDNKPRLRDAIRGYFRQRSEDDLYTGKDKIIP